ncbi:sporulation protein YabP [Alicyclobacillus tolerans]|uniref:Sporulation protein YabP n=2 Tax=Alicyclobacillus tolerans TaxID=90970 RepID=A0A1M6PFT9_9BACL|nr:MULTISPECIES: sporulation protein YabP [Alicyclobacillus]MDP9729758.1 sporulation protein YabP [Alicyclobacillus tengchongensis]QRF22360.1 sporulation protein YabP [Alicyclobacillus sp. TC]SHK06770.1 sporulation protein YabP [Alicyclobacillus montanus]
MAELSTHHIHLDGRRRADITGVSSVESFDVHEFTLKTTAGMLQVKGANLHMKHLDLESGQVIIEGTVHGMQYIQENKKKSISSRFKW